MFEVRIHGRGGQGVVTAAEMLSVAAFMEGKHAQAFPSFGSERIGAPVVAFCRIDDKEIRLREPIQTPDALIIQDPTLFKALDVTEGLKANGYLIVNTTRPLEDMKLPTLPPAMPSPFRRRSLRSDMSAALRPTRRCSAPSRRRSASSRSAPSRRRSAALFPAASAKPTSRPPARPTR